MTQSFARARDLFLEGTQHFEAGRWAAAESALLASLALVPGRVSTLVNLGATRIKLHRPEEALAALAEAIASEPDNIEAWSHRGIALADLGRHEDALACYDEVLAIDSASTAVLYHRGIALSALQRHEEALDAFDRMLAIQPNLGGAWFRRGQALQALARHEEALIAYEKALALDPELGHAWSRRGGILKDLKRLDEAAACFREAVARGADVELNRYYLASVAAESVPPLAPSHYVQLLFDDYAEQFDEHLVRVLNYQAHTVLTDHLERPGGRRFGSALDLGCGTGLCAPFVKSIADRLDGVDLSRKMLDKAAARGLYDRLVQADIVAHLQGTDQRYDLALSADVFIYIGDLAPVFGGVRRVMHPGGVFCFSVELAEDGKDFELMPSSRYAHSLRYIRSLAAQHGFDVAKVLQHPVREDQRQPIPGLFVYLSVR